ncbi:ankyrin repeat domain-containing protein [Candidatus Dependentiae bacterium]|nr:ankyrin repeat domain-containing protein [Candidatus Dependentiae bacterium]
MKKQKERSSKGLDSDHKEVIRILVEEGYVSLDAINQNGETALDLARIENNEIMAAFLESLSSK